MGPIRRHRGIKNRDPEAGMNNREAGLSKKSHTFFEFYGGQVLLIIKRSDGRYGGYQSHQGLLKELAQQDIPENVLSTPESYTKQDPDPTASRSTSPPTYANANEVQSSPTSRVSSTGSSFTSSTGFSTHCSSPLSTPYLTTSNHSPRPTTPVQELSFPPQAAWHKPNLESQALTSTIPIFQPKPISERQRKALLTLYDSCFD